MSTTTMLQLVQQATGEMGLSVPTVVAGATGQDTIQQLALLNAVGYELMQQFPWQALNKAYLFSTLSYTLTGSVTQGLTSASASTTPGPSILDTTYQITGPGINQGTYLAQPIIISGVAPYPGGFSLSQAATASYTAQTYTVSKVQYTLPSDYARQIDRTHWDKSKHWEMLGPLSAQEWEYLISGYISTGPRIRYRIFGNLFNIWPPVTTGDTLGFEYISNAWAADSGGTAKSSFTANTDTCIFPDRLMVLGLMKKYFQAKGFDWSNYDRDYRMELDIAKAADAGSQTLAMAPRLGDVLIRWDQIPDSGYGS